MLVVIKMILFLLVVSISGCPESDGQVESDGGFDGDAFDGAGDLGADPGSDVGDELNDFDPSGEFLLQIDPETSLCGGFCEGRTWQEELAMVGRINLKPGVYILPRRPGSYSTDLVESILFGPGQTELQLVSGNPEFTAVDRAADGWWYSFTADYSQAGKNIHIELTFAIRQNDDGWPIDVAVSSENEQLTVWGRLIIEPGVDQIDEIQAFGLCDLAEVTRLELTFDTQQGSNIELELRDGPYYRACLAGGKTQCRFLVSGKVRLGTYQSNISDRFRLVYAGSHHNWNDEYLILLDPPTAGIAALLVSEPDQQLVLMDSDFVQLRLEGFVE